MFQFQFVEKQGKGGMSEWQSTTEMSEAAWKVLRFLPYASKSSYILEEVLEKASWGNVLYTSKEVGLGEMSKW